MRLLLQRHDHQGVGTAVEDATTDRTADSSCDERSSLSLRHLPADRQGHSTRRHSDGGEGMSTRREFIKSGGALIVGFSLSEEAALQSELNVGLYAQAP